MLPSAPIDIGTLSRLIDRFGEVPRYTSYPTAPHFRVVENDIIWKGWLGDIPDRQSLSLYLHVPFCRSMCWYCGCATQVVKGDDALTDYVDALLTEIALTAQYLPSRARIAHIHWGGGTPTILGTAGLQRVMERLSGLFSFDPQIEIAVEVDPRRFDAELARSLVDCGVNRASLGVQSFDPDVQRAIHRIQPLESVVRTADLLRDVGITSLNFDILYGLPHQTADSLARTIAHTIQLRPERVALFGYAHVPWMRPHQKRIDNTALPDRDQRLEQFLLSEALLNDAGYASIGLDHFALPTDALAIAAHHGNLHRNFQGYTTDRSDMLVGFGTSAISQLPQGYASNMRGAASWRRKIATGQLPVERILPLSQEDRMRAAVIEQLMCNLQVDLDAQAAIFGLPSQPLHSGLAALQPVIDAGLLHIQGGTLSVRPQGRVLLRQICSAFDAYLHATSGARHAAA
ncbi:MAG: oxygen-independent coproporphyrinogen III oxidase [Alphaproteobacteria bacterium]|nr:oxygen-independent coproporphyrinogen III oxidase [Alphaproteobacteria bacterium]